MTRPTVTARYPKSAIALHWLMLAMIIAVYAAILLRENFPRGSATRETFKMWHFMLKHRSVRSLQFWDSQNWRMVILLWPDRPML